MITGKSRKNAKQYCRCDISMIEGYEAALNDPNEKYSVHHVLEPWFTTDELKDKGLYYDVHPDFLIWMPFSVHHNNCVLHKSRMEHNRKMNKDNPNFKGKHHSEETRRIISEKTQGRIPWNYKGGK